MSSIVDMYAFFVVVRSTWKRKEKEINSIWTLDLTACHGIKREVIIIIFFKHGLILE